MSKEFGVGVCVHSQLFFIIILETIQGVHGSCYDYADDLMINVESLEGLLLKVVMWKSGMEKARL